MSDSMANVEKFALCVIEGSSNLVPATIKEQDAQRLSAVTEYELPTRVRIHLLPCDPSDTYSVREVVSHPETIHGHISDVDRGRGFRVRISSIGSQPESAPTPAAPSKPQAPPEPQSPSAPSSPKNGEKAALGQERNESVRLKSYLWNGALAIEVSGTLDVSGAALLDRIAREALRRRCNLVLDMKSVEYLPSPGLGVLIALVRDLNDADVKVALANTVGDVQRVVEISRLNQLIETFKTVEEAVNAL